jgi:hypothetical protein
MFFGIVAKFRNGNLEMGLTKLFVYYFRTSA